MKTRKKKIDVLKLLEISHRSKNIPKKSKQKQGKGSNDVSDKENVSHSNEVARVSNQNLQPRRSEVLSPVRDRNVITNVLSGITKGAPEATSTPHNVRKTLFPDISAVNPSTKEPEKDDTIYLSDSDCTDTEIEVPELQKNYVAKTNNKRKRGRKVGQSTETIISVETALPKRVIRPTYKALNSPVHRKFFTTPRIDPEVNAVKLNQKGTLVVEVPSRIALSEKIPLPKKKKPIEHTVDDAVRMPAPVAAVKKGPRAKRAVRLYSEPKPVPHIDVVPKYRQELEKQEIVNRTLRRQGSAVGDDDIYNFHPSQEITSEPKQDDSYIKGLIERLKKRKKVVRKQKNTQKTSKKVDEKSRETAVTEKQRPPEQNKTDAIIEKIRKRLSDKQPVRSSLRKSGPDDVSPHHEKTIRFETVVDQENVPLGQSPIPNRSIVVSPGSRDISMLPPMTSPMTNSPNQSRVRIIRDPVPGTSTGGWTGNGKHSTPNQKSPYRNTSLSRPFLQSSLNRSVNSATSPWRVNEEARVPRTKYFSLSKDLLPSYSSDIIVHDTIPFVPDRISTSSNRSLNNSDAENVAPIPRRMPEKTVPSKRVPLGALDVAEVHPLSEKHQPIAQSPLVRHSLTSRQMNKNQTPPQIQVISNVPVTGQRYRLSGDRLTLQSPDVHDEDSNDSVCSANSNVSECFGFDVSSVQEDVSIDAEISVTDLKQKLQNLKQVFPLEKSVSQNVEMPVLFKSPMKQTNTLKTMFDTNAPIERPSEQAYVGDSSDSSDIETTETLKSNKKEESGQKETESVPIKLFDDPEDLRVKHIPVAKRRSYAGRQKRKRIQFSDYETSDSELEDNNDEDGISDKHKQKRRKREKPDVEKSEEFQQFVSEFNSMCDEVEQYELVVEPIE